MPRRQRRRLGRRPQQRQQLGRGVDGIARLAVRRLRLHQRQLEPELDHRRLASSHALSSLAAVLVALGGTTGLARPPRVAYRLTRIAYEALGQRHLLVDGPVVGVGALQRRELLEQLLVV